MKFSRHRIGKIIKRQSKLFQEIWDFKGKLGIWMLRTIDFKRSEVFEFLACFINKLINSFREEISHVIRNYVRLDL